MRIILILVPLIAAGPAVAYEPLEPVIVTATRTEMAAKDVLPSAVVIDRDQIESSLAKDIAELLQFHAGLELGRNGGPGQTTSLFIRGTESNHTLVLIDGVEINPGTIGGAALQNISPLLIERIEIVKGPRSTLYGSEAIGGVVNIITRNNEGVELRAGGGRYGSRAVSLSAGLADAVHGLSLSLGRRDSDGFPTRNTAGAPDRGYDNQSFGLNATRKMADADFSLRHWQSTGNTEYVDFSIDPVDQDYANRATALTFSSQPAALWSTALTLSDIADDIEQQQSVDYARTDRTALDWQNNLQTGDRHSLVAGLYVARETTRALSFGTGFDERTDVRALYLQDYINLPPGQLLLAARHTAHDSAGSNTTWNAEYGHRLDNGWRITAGLGTAFRAPDATDRFGFGGNPTLRSEDSRSAEIGVDRHFGQHQFRLSAFRNEINDLIEFVFDPETFDGSNFNIAQARITGIDASYGWSHPAWRLTVGALLQDPRDLQNDTTLARRARRSLTVNIDRLFAGYRLGVDILATSARKDSPFSDTINAGYVLANLSAQWDINQTWSLQGRIENLLDSDYETAAGFRSPGRGLTLSARYRVQ